MITKTTLTVIVGDTKARDAMHSDNSLKKLNPSRSTQTLANISAETKSRVMDAWFREARP